MLQVTIDIEDCVNNGAFVLIGAVAHAIARAKGSSNLRDAERKIFGYVNSGVQSKALNPVDAENLTPLSRSDYGQGIVAIEELIAWGKSLSIQLEFKLAKDNRPTAPVANASDGRTTLPAVPNWKMRTQAEATELCLRLRKSGANPTKHSILGPMAAWCRDNGVKTDTNIFPSEGYLRTWVLGGKHWDVPH